MSGTNRAKQTPSLEVSNNYDSDTMTYLLVKPKIIIGRDPSSDIIINRPFISRPHLRIEQSGEQFFIVHPAKDKTTNGLIYQGRHIQGRETFRKALVHGDVFRIGDEHGTLITLSFDDGSGQDSIPDIDPIPLNAQEI